MLNLLKDYNKTNKTKKNNNLIIPQVKKGNDVGITRHFPLSTKSWYNSLYFFNKNISRSMLYLDIFVNNLIKLYFNLISNVNEDLKFMRRRSRIRNRSVNRIFVSRTEINHSNDKVVITIYTYNRIKKYYFKKLLGLYKNIFNLSNIPDLNIFNLNSFKLNKANKLKDSSINDKSFKTLNKLYLVNYFKNLYEYNKLYILLFKKFKDIYFKYSSIFERFLFYSDYMNKILKHKKLFSILNNLNKNKISVLFKLEQLNNFKKYKEKNYNSFIKHSLDEEISYLNYNQSLMVDTNKYNHIYLSRLNNIISNIYNKKIEFNIINLKYAHLDTHILSESVDIKMKNRGNTPIKILQKVLLLPKINNLRTYNYNTQDLYKANYNNIDLNKIYFDNNKDVLNSILSNILNVKLLSDSYYLKDKYIYRSIKFRKVRGIRLEAKGRITRRLTASRSMSKLVYKGSLKNLDSSVNGLSSVLLRGHLNSNIDYLNINSKTRNGAFGLKGWISSK